MCFSYFYHGALPHEAVTKVLLERSLKAGGTLIDVGANIGYYTRIGSHLVGDTGKVVAFEPEPGNLELLKANTADLNNVTVHSCALSDTISEVDFFVHKSGDQSSLLPLSRSQRISVRTVTLDSVSVDTTGCNFIKLDIEGAEYQAIVGGRELIARSGPIVYFEHIEPNPIPITRYIEFFKTFQRHEYRLFRANNSNELLAPLSARTNCNYLVAVPSRSVASLSI
jgi:FkbM family methyltransferase